jgi:hypothetical protein
MSNVAYTPLDAPSTRSKPGWVLTCTDGECRFDSTNNNRNRYMRLRFHDGVARLLGAALLASLVACAPREPLHGPNDTFASSVTAMDHDPSDTFVPTVYVNGRWVGEASMGGGIVADGISLPYKWRPGLTAVVKWERCDRFDPKHPVPDEQACRWTEKVVPIHQYDDVGGTWLHILSDDQVLIIPSMLGPGHPDYPGPNLPTKDFFSNTSRERKDAE